MLISMNKLYKSRFGVAITGVDVDTGLVEAGTH